MGILLLIDIFIITENDFQEGIGAAKSKEKVMTSEENKVPVCHENKVLRTISCCYSCSN